MCKKNKQKKQIKMMILILFSLQLDLMTVRAACLLQQPLGNLTIAWPHVQS